MIGAARWLGTACLLGGTTVLAGWPELAAPAFGARLAGDVLWLAAAITRADAALAVTIGGFLLIDAWGAM